MNTQVNVRMSKTLFTKAKKYAKEKGYTNVQELMRDSLRETIDPELTPEEHYFIKKMIDGIEQGKVKLGTEKELWKALGGKP